MCCAFCWSFWLSVFTPRLKWIYFFFPISLSLSLWVDHSLISLKRFNLFPFGTYVGFHSIRYFFGCNPSNSTYLIWFAFDLAVRVYFFFSSSTGPDSIISQYHIPTMARNKEPSDNKLTNCRRVRAKEEKKTKQNTTFLFDFICNSRICIIPFAELFFVDGYFLRFLWAWANFFFSPRMSACNSIRIVHTT